MYLFSRQRIANPASARAAMAWASEAAHRVREVSGQDINLWMSSFSGPVGRFAFTSWLEHLDEIEAVYDKLGADAGYQDFVEKGASLFIGPAEDAMMQVVHGTPTTDLPAYVQSVTAHARPDNLAGAMELGVAIAQKATELTGIQTMFAGAVTGPFDGCGWLTGVPDLATMERGNAETMASAEWQGLLASAGDAYLPGSITTVYRRLV